MRYFIYCRKSQKSEDRQVLSIKSQIHELTGKFSKSPDTEIVDIFKESQSAMTPGRPVFAKMMQRIQAGEADGIIAWHPDRLSRNSIDAGLLIYNLDRQIIKDFKFATYTFENTPEGKLMLGMMFGYSKYYSDNLSKNIKRGNREKLRNGWRPNSAPIGYLNDSDSRTIIPDPKRFEIIKELFQLMVSGSYTPAMLHAKARDDFGLRTIKKKRIGGKPLSLSGVYRLLSNPFYTGLILWNGDVHKGKHKPLVSVNDFDKVQKILKRKNLKARIRKPKLQFAFTGMIKCGECGCLITAERKKNRFNTHYIYYHCTHRKSDYNCKQKSVEVTNLESQISKFLDEIVISPKIHDLLLKIAETELDSDRNLLTAKIASLQSVIRKNETKLKNLVDMRMNDLLNDDEFKTERCRLKKEIINFEQQAKTLEENQQWFEPFKSYLKLRKQAKVLFENGDLEAKRLILQTVGSNPTIFNKKLSIQAAKPFIEIPNSPKIGDLRGVVKDIRKTGGYCDGSVTLSTLNKRKNKKFNILHE